MMHQHLIPQIDGGALKALPITVEVPQSSLTRASLKPERLGPELALIIIHMVSTKEKPLQKLKLISIILMPHIFNRITYV